MKARLLVHKGATLVGVLDEYGVLEEDEVFVQVISAIYICRLWIDCHPLLDRCMLSWLYVVSLVCVSNLYAAVFKRVCTDLIFVAASRPHKYYW
jgi:hypothetical protein